MQVCTDPAGSVRRTSRQSPMWMVVFIASTGAGRGDPSAAILASFALAAPGVGLVFGRQAALRAAMAVALLHRSARREVLILEEPIAELASVFLTLAVVAAAIFTRPAPGVTAWAVARAAGSIVASHRGCLLV